MSDSDRPVILRNGLVLTLDDAHTVLPNQQTVAEYIGPQVAQMYETGRMPAANRTLTSGAVIDVEP